MFGRKPRQRPNITPAQERSNNPKDLEEAAKRALEVSARVGDGDAERRYGRSSQLQQADSVTPREGSKGQRRHRGKAWWYIFAWSHNYISAEALSVLLDEGSDPPGE